MYNGEKRKKLVSLLVIEHPFYIFRCCSFASTIFTALLECMDGLHLFSKNFHAVDLTMSKNPNWLFIGKNTTLGNQLIALINLFTRIVLASVVNKSRDLSVISTNRSVLPFSNMQSVSTITTNAKESIVVAQTYLNSHSNKNAELFVADLSKW